LVVLLVISRRGHKTEGCLSQWSWIPSYWAATSEGW